MNFFLLLIFPMGKTNISDFLSYPKYICDTVEELNDVLSLYSAVQI